MQYQHHSSHMRLLASPNATVQTTWVGEKYLVAKPEVDFGIANVIRFRDCLLAERMKMVEAGTTQGRVGLLQT